MSVQKLESQIDPRKEQPAIFMFPIAFLSLALLLAGTFEFIPSWVMRDLVDLPHLWHIAGLGALAVRTGGPRSPGMQGVGDPWADMFPFCRSVSGDPAAGCIGERQG